jgi:quercetin dioxygenase-like cupin family protein
MPRVEKCEGGPPSADEIRGRFRDEGLDPTSWDNAPGDTYGWHEHEYHKVLYCVSGSIDFHTPEGDLSLEAGDRLDLEPGTRHAATVGPAGVQCMEAPRRERH